MDTKMPIVNLTPRLMKVNIFRRLIDNLCARETLSILCYSHWLFSGQRRVDIYVTFAFPSRKKCRRWKCSQTRRVHVKQKIVHVTRSCCFFKHPNEILSSQFVAFILRSCNCNWKNDCTIKINNWLFLVCLIITYRLQLRWDDIKLWQLLCNYSD